MKLWWGEFNRFFFMVGEWGRSKFLASGRETPLIFPSRGNTARRTVEKLHFYGYILTKYELT